MKKIMAVLLGMILIFGAVACSSGTTETIEAPQTTQAQTEAPQTTEAETTAAQETETAAQTAEAESENGGVLIVYFSATGNTEQAANYIAEITGGDLFELEPVDPYTDEDLNYNDEDSRVVYEHENPEAQNIELVADTVENWDSYDTVFVGYPIWWQSHAWPIDDFIEANDFTGKTVIPFCTSASSGLGESDAELAELAGTGQWLDGIRFGSNVSREDVEQWLEGLNL